MTRFNRQRVKAATRVEIRTETPELFAAGASGQLALHGRWPVTPRSAHTPPAVLRSSALSVALLTNHQGGAGWQRDPRTDLFVLAVTHFSGQHSFYENAADREERFTSLVRRLALEDPRWTLGLLRWLRGQAQIRSAAVVGAVEFARARAEAKAPGYSRQAVDAVLQRPDEPGEFLALWTARYGRRLPQPVRRGLGDAVRRLYTSRAVLKYDTPSHAFRFADVLELTHPAPAADHPWQGELFRYVLDRRHRPHQAVPPRTETLLTERQRLAELPVTERRAVLAAPDAAHRLAAAGMTWEALAGWLKGPMDAAAWEAVIPSMGAMALVRNLRNFDQAGIGDAAATLVAARIADPAQVARSRQFPFRFLAAHRAAPGLRWAAALETALSHSLANVPHLPGRTLVLVDRSGSMFGVPESRTELTRADAAAVFGGALALRAEQADLVEFGTGSRPIRLAPDDSLLAVVERFHDLGGTDTAGAVARHFDGHHRVVVITDEQPGLFGPLDPFAPVPPGIPVYTWNLCGYRTGHAPPAPNRHVFGGLSDAAFRLVPLLEAGGAEQWPWERPPAASG
ncbi:TROVE domain-containing protein [Kitasatospora sp. NPDC088783]|uniref:TROVE domain-containing protein n=1 Tax=Kitasatospora sp. NPDC088783 TaxID=3364077 RepID=UPI003821DFC3